MADSDSIIEVLLKLGVIGQSDVKAANELITQTSTAARDAGKAADFLNPAMVGAGKATTEASEASKGLLENHRLLHAALHQTGAEIPGLSALLHGMFNPATIGLVAGMTAMQAYFEHVKKVQEQQLEWIKQLQKTNDSLHEITSSGKTAGEQLIDINKALADGQVKAQGHARAIEQMTQEWKRYDEVAKDTAAAEKEASADSETAMKSRIDLLEKAKIISKQVADDLRAGAAYEAEVSKVRNERAAKELEYSNTSKKLTEAYGQQDKLPSPADAQKKLKDDQSALDRNEAIIKDMPGVIKTLQANFNEAWDKRDVKTERQLQAQIDANQKVLDKAKTDNPDLEKKVSQDKDTVAAIDSLKKTIDDLNSQLRTMTQGIADFEKSSQAHLDQAAQGRNRTEFGSGAAEMLKQAEEIAKRYQLVQQGKAPRESVSQSEIAEMTRVSEFTTGRVQTAKTAMGTMLAATKDLNVFMNDVDRLTNAMEQIVYTMPNNLKNRMAAIEAYIARGDRPRQ